MNKEKNELKKKNYITNITYQTLYRYNHRQYERYTLGPGLKGQVKVP